MSHVLVVYLSWCPMFNLRNGPSPYPLRIYVALGLISLVLFRDCSLTMGRGGGLQNRVGGASFTPMKKGGGKSFSHAEGGGNKKF